MLFTETKLKGAFVIELERREDTRGYFARAFCRHEFAEHGLNPDVMQVNMSHNFRRGTVRGMHFQYPPHAEVKIVRACRGAIVDVIVDLRPESPTFLQHESVELSADSGRALYVPERFAHGYQTLEDASDVVYLVSEFYAPQADGGLMPFDAGLGISWPLPVTEISAKDAGWRSLEEAVDEVRRGMTVPT